MTTEEAFNLWWKTQPTALWNLGPMSIAKLAYIAGAIHGIDLAKQASREVFFSEQIEMSGKDHRAEDLS